MTAIKVLAVRQPYASLIVEGLKTIEVRSRPTNIRERVAIYASTNIPSMNTLAYTFSTLGRWDHYETLSETDQEKYAFLNDKAKHEYEYGQIIGTVEITDSSKISIIEHSSYSEWQWLYKNSYAPAKMIKNGNYYWNLEKPVKFSEPINYKPPKGAVVWSNFDLPEEYL